jgi:hypothetical protein
MIELIVVIILLLFVFEVVMFIDAIRNNNITANKKILWIIGMLLIHPFLAIA